MDSTLVGDVNYITPQKSSQFILGSVSTEHILGILVTITKLER